MTHDNVIQMPEVFRRRRYFRTSSGLASFDAALTSAPLVSAPLLVDGGFAVTGHNANRACTEVICTNTAGLVVLFNPTLQHMEWEMDGKPGRGEDMKDVVWVLPEGTEARWMSRHGMPIAVHIHVAQCALKQRQPGQSRLDRPAAFHDPALAGLFTMMRAHLERHPLDGRIASVAGRLCIDLLERAGCDGRLYS